MIIIGLDPSSASSGIALVRDDVPESVAIWKPQSKMKTQFEKLISWGDFVRGLLIFQQPDLVIIEEIGRAPQGNVRTMRTLVRFEAVATYETVRAGVDVILHPVSQAREIAVGTAKAGKEFVYKTMTETYPDLDWRSFDKGGNDQSDALAMALAAPTIIERR